MSYDRRAGLLARTEYDPVGLLTASIATTTVTDVDATNLTITFTPPANGNVRIELSATGGLNNAHASTPKVADYIWSLRVGGAEVTDADMYVLASQVAANTGMFARITTVHTFSGLTAGTPVTWKWAHKLAAAVADMEGRVYAGSTLGPAVMEAWAVNL